MIEEQIKDLLIEEVKNYVTTMVAKYYSPSIEIPNPIILSFEEKDDVVRAILSFNLESFEAHRLYKATLWGKKLIIEEFSRSNVISKRLKTRINLTPKPL